MREGRERRERDREREKTKEKKKKEMEKTLFFKLSFIVEGTTEKVYQIVLSTK